MLPLSLVHDDYWPGNTVWHRGRLTGIVDWGSAGLGDRRTDIAQCRVDLTLMHGAERAHQFAAAYASIAGEAAVKDLWFWDAYLSLHALASLHYFEAGYIDLGLRDEDMQARRQRLERFLEDALALAG
jgi:aminoglycoside phosphotransferase (APT) family kinase protein